LDEKSSSRIGAGNRGYREGLTRRFSRTAQKE
jgi:hypothetical protein